MRVIICALVIFTGIFNFSCNSELENGKEKPVTREAAKKTNKEQVKDEDVKQGSDFLVSANESIMFQIKLAEQAKLRAVSAPVREIGEKYFVKYLKTSEEIQKIASTKQVSLSEILSDIKMNKYKGFLEKTGIDFDKEYLNLTKSNVQDNLDKYRGVAGHAKDEEIRYWAGNKFSELELQLIETEECEKKLKKLDK